MSTEQVAKKVVELVRKEAWHEAIDTLYDKNIVSVEAYGMGGESPEKRGIEAVRGKTDWWVNNMEIHSFKASDPFVAHDRFVVLALVTVELKVTKSTKEDLQCLTSF